MELAPLIITVALLIIPVLLGSFWLFRDKRASENFLTNSEMFLDKINMGKKVQSDFWNRILRPFWQINRRVVHFFEKKLLNDLLNSLWEAPVEALKTAFSDFEEKIFDIKITKGIADVFESVGKSLKIVHNGQVQFYFVLGLLLIAAIVIRFTFVGG
jgi:hypothetical protein